MSNWKFSDSTRRVAFRVNADGEMESGLVDACEHIVEFLESGGIIEDPDA